MRRRLATLVVVVAAGTAGTGVLWAYFNAGAVAGSHGRAAAGTLQPVNTPSVSLSERDVVVTWTKSSPSTGYTVTRYAESGGEAIEPRSACDGVQQGLPFTIAGNAVGPLYPGAPFGPLALTITNPNDVPILVTAITVTVTGDSNGCAAADVELQQSAAAPTNELAVPANAVDWPVPAAFQPKIRLKESGANQDSCQNQTFGLSYTGSAHS